MRKLLIFILLLCLTTSASGQFFAPNQKPMLGLKINGGHPLGDPVAFYLFNEGSGGQVFDLSGSGHEGTLKGTAHFVPGKFGPAVDVDGDSDYIDISGTSYNPKECTYVTWAKADSLSASCVLYSDSSSSATERIRIMMNIGGGYYVTNDYGISTANAPCDVTKWHQVAFTISQSNSYSALYIDGVVGITDDIFDITVSTAGTIQFIGARYGPSNYFPGLIDHFMIYNRALSASEIALLYREPFCMVGPSFNWVLYGGITIAPTGGQVIFITN